MYKHRHTPLNPMELTGYQLQDFFENHCSWKFAKTMPKWPHWYTLIQEDTDRDFWFSVIRHIRRHGYPEAFYRKVFLRLNINGWQYWTTNGAMHEHALINRAKLKSTTNYDNLADDYDTLFVDETSKQEEQAIISRLEGITGKTLDIGCGTGLFLEYFNDRIQPSDYVGIDPARKMLVRLNDKFPEYGKGLRAVSAESFIWTGDFDNIVAMYSASYVSDLDCFIRYWNGKGKLLLIFYKEGYSPVSHRHLEYPPNFWAYEPAFLQDHFPDADIEVAGNYVIVAKG